MISKISGVGYYRQKAIEYLVHIWMLAVLPYESDDKISARADSERAEKYSRLDAFPAIST